MNVFHCCSVTIDHKFVRLFAPSSYSIRLKIGEKYKKKRTTVSYFLSSLPHFAHHLHSIDDLKEKYKKINGKKANKKKKSRTSIKEKYRDTNECRIVNLNAI